MPKCLYWAVFIRIVSDIKIIIFSQKCPFIEQIHIQSKQWDLVRENNVYLKYFYVTNE